uniref:Alpha-macroglobulin receptor-binding domain-containing protein n=1 Tax=Anopheles quadriannulatus TaxID=34691 RepID=A0A182X466_ANOQN
MCSKEYMLLMTCLTSNGLFDNVTNNVSKIFYTAFVANTLDTAPKKVRQTSNVKLEKAFDWLASRQQRFGSFKRAEFDPHYKRSEIALTSYVLAAMLGNESAKVKHAVVVEKGMRFLSKQLDLITSANDLAIATYAMMLYGHSLKNAAFEKLIDVSTITNNGAERYWNTSNSVEATSYALLSHVVANKLLGALPIMRWLVNQRSEIDSVSGQQNTYIRLKALSSIAKKVSPNRNDYHVQVKYKKNTKWFRFDSYDNDTKNITIPQDIKMLEINVAGVGAGFLEVFYRYSLNLMNFEHRFQLDLLKQNTSSDNELRLNVCANYMPTLRDSRSNMALIEVTLPSGYAVDRNPMNEQTTENPIQHIEIRYGGTSVVLYYNSMGSERNCFTVSAYKRFKVALKRPVYVVVYEYYTSE